MKKKVNITYIKHDINSRDDEGMLTIRARFGMEGYRIFWALIEMMRAKETLSLKYPPSIGISHSLGVDEAKMKQLVDLCLSEKLFASNGESFWSERLQKDVEKSEKTSSARSESGKKGGINSGESRLKKKQNEANASQMPSKSEANSKQNEAVKLREVKKIIPPP